MKDLNRANLTVGQSAKETVRSPIPPRNAAIMTEPGWRA